MLMKYEDVVKIFNANIDKSEHFLGCHTNFEYDQQTGFIISEGIEVN